MNNSGSLIKSINKVLNTISSLSGEERKSVSNLEKKVKSILEFDRQNGTLNGR